MMFILKLISSGDNKKMEVIGKEIPTINIYHGNIRIRVSIQFTAFYAVFTDLTWYNFK